MILTNPAQQIDNQIIPRHVVEIYCPECGRDVDEQELDAQKCNDCGKDLGKPLQSVSIFATTVPAAGGSTMP